jgi:hypothetical protein
MPANRMEPVSVPFWFQSRNRRPHGGLLQALVGAGHAREQKVARMAGCYIFSRSRGRS